MTEDLDHVSSTEVPTRISRGRISLNSTALSCNKACVQYAEERICPYSIHGHSRGHLTLPHSQKFRKPRTVLKIRYPLQESQAHIMQENQLKLHCTLSYKTWMQYAEERICPYSAHGIQGAFNSTTFAAIQEALESLEANRAITRW